MYLCEIFNKNSPRLKHFFGVFKTGDTEMSCFDVYLLSGFVLHICTVVCKTPDFSCCCWPKSCQLPSCHPINQSLDFLLWFQCNQDIGTLHNCLMTNKKITNKRILDGRTMTCEKITGQRL